MIATLAITLSAFALHSSVPPVAPAKNLIVIERPHGVSIGFAFPAPAEHKVEAALTVPRRSRTTLRWSIPPVEAVQVPAFAEPLFPKFDIVQDSLRTDAPSTSTYVAIPAGPSKLCSINVANTDLARILQELSTQTKTNLILLTNPDTKLTLRLSKVRLTDMIRHLAAVTGLSYLQVGETWVMASEAQLKKGYSAEWAKAHPEEEVAPVEPKPDVVIETYTVRNVDSTQIAQALEKLYGSQITVIAGPAPTSPSVAQQNTNGSVGSAGAGVLQRDQAQSSQTGRVLVMKGAKDLVAAAMAIAKRMDYARMQWVVKVTVNDISNDALKELGLTWSFSNVTVTEGARSGLGFGSFTRTPLSFLSTISALESQGKAKVLATPEISGLDGERGFILIGDKLSFPNLIGYSQAGTPIFESKEIQVGIYLQVAGSVADDQSLTLSIYPQVSAIKNFKSINGALYPDVATREAQTTLRAKAGETIVLAGMLREEEIQFMQKVPILSELPILGELFKHRRRTKTASHVIITLTPTVIPVP